MNAKQNKHENFLEFNGKSIVFLNVDGTYWIALKPILEALNMDADRSIKTLKKDPILAPERSKQTVQVSKNGNSQLRNMTCLPEKYIYGWIFSLRSDSEELIEYKRTCYDLLYNHFHGVISNRKELLLERLEIKTEIHNITEELKEKENRYKKLQELKNKQKSVSRKLNGMDKEFIEQPGFWSNN